MVVYYSKNLQNNVLINSYETYHLVSPKIVLLHQPTYHLSPTLISKPAAATAGKLEK